jgi:hypothetical protein
MKHHPMTKEQREILNQDLATITYRLSDITILLNACYGIEDARAEEAQAALQRLLWALERQGLSLTVGRAVGSTRVREIVETDAKAQQQFESQI